MRPTPSLLSLLAVVLVASAAPSTAGAAPERGLELVSPADAGGNDIKEGGTNGYGSDTHLRRAAVAGGAVSFASFGAVTGSREEGNNENQYVSRRTPGGWVTRFVGPPSTRVANAAIVAYTDDLRRSLSIATRGASPDPADPEPEANSLVNRLLARDEAGRFTRLNIGPSAAPLPEQTEKVEVYAFDQDLKHVLFSDTRGLLDPVDAPASNQTGVFLRSGSTITRLPITNAISGKASADFARAYVVTPTDTAQTVMFWSEGQGVVDIGASRRTTPGPGLPPGTFAQVNLSSVSADGSSALLETNLALTDDDDDSDYDLYEFRLPPSGQAADGTLRLLTGGAETVADRPATFVDASVDDARRYFVTTERLTPDAGDGPNLYLQDDDATRLVATLAPGEESAISGVDKARNATRMTPDGDVLVFPSTAALAGAPGGSANVFRYDATSEELTCVSCVPGEQPAGDSSLGNPDVRAATRGENLANGGRTVFFQSSARLTPDDTDDLVDVYERDLSDGSLTLLSTGTTTQAADYWDNSADGRDVFFTTRQRLVPQDLNGDGDARRMYDARVGGGFPPEASPAPCTGDGCRGQVAGRPDASSPASGVVSGAGDPKVANPVAPRGSLRLQALTKAQLRALRRTKRLQVRLTGLAPRTTLTVTVDLLHGKARRRFAAGTRSVRSASSARVSLRLTSRGRALLRQKRSLRLRVTVRDRAAKRSIQSTLTVPASR